MTQALFFHFEADFVQSLRCIPMQVRYKLDTCGVKLKLQHWNQFDDRDRHHLVEWPCNTDRTIQQYRDQVRQLVYTQTGTYPKDLPIEDEPPWSCLDVIPVDVLTEAQRWHQALSLQQWRSLSDLQRFALIKLSRPGHENRNFQPALIEFGLAQAPIHRT
jgi:hypothetical protein